MSSFFEFYTSIKSEKAFPMFGFSHITILLFLTVTICIFLQILKKVPPSIGISVIKCAAVLVAVLELSHTVWLCFCGQTQIVKLLPLHLCSMQSFFIPLAVFTKGTRFKDYVYATSVLGGVFGIVFPAGVAGNYPIWHFQTLQTALLHGLLVFVPLALIAVTDYRPSIKRFSGVLKIFMVVAVVAAAVDFSFGENYIFLMIPPERTPFEWVFNHFGRNAYWFSAFVSMCAASLLIHIPFLPSALSGEQPEEETVFAKHQL